MITSILDQGLGVMTDPARLHAELWGDHFSKVISCWLPLLMSTIVVGRDLLGSSIQCFPLSLVNVTVQSENETFCNMTSSNAFSGVSGYTRQLSEFVNTYCAGENSSMFSYHFFAMMLVVQAGVMYAPFLIWNVTKGREIIAIVRFITYDMEVFYGRFRKPNTQGQGQANGQRVVYGQDEFEEAEKQWRADCTMYIWYVFKQVVSIVISVLFFGCYWFQPISICGIRDKFSCPVEEKFSVTCTVPTATVHKFVWGTNMVLLGMNVLIILINVFVLYKCAEEYPFAEIGPGAEQTNDGHENMTEGSDNNTENVDQAEAQPLAEAQCRVSCVKRWPHFNDSSLMYAFFKANIESVEKYHHVKNLIKVAPRRPVT